MAKSLGQIHTVSQEFANVNYSLAPDNELLIDLPGQLTTQLQHMCRMMSNYKVVGIDMDFGPILNASPISAHMNGKIMYYAPTKGRIEALKSAYHSVRRMMKLSGVEPGHAISYDFRPIITDPANFENSLDVKNWASIEDNGLASTLSDGPAGAETIFDNYNKGILPRSFTSATWQDGFDIGLRSNANSADWTLNEGVYLVAGTDPLASEEMEYIPFSLTYTDSEAASVTVVNFTNSDQLQWRPDPALYLSVLTGQLIIHIDDSGAVTDDGTDAMDQTQLEVAVHVAGWKGILGDKKRRPKRGKKHHGRKRRSSKRKK